MRKTNTIWYHLYVELKIQHKWTYLQNKNRVTDTENRLVLVKGEKGANGIDWESGINRCKLLYIEWTNNMVLLYSTGNNIQYPGINHNGKEGEKECIYMYNYSAVQQKITQLYKSTNTSIKLNKRSNGRGESWSRMPGPWLAGDLR